MLLVPLLVAVASAAAAPGMSPGSPAPPDPILSRLQTRLETLKTLRGRFIQSLDAPALGRPRVEEGTFALKRPSMMRWEYEKPEKKLAILDGRNSWLYLPEEREVHRGSLKEIEDAGAVTLMLAGRIKLTSDFRCRRLSLDEAGPQGVAGALVLELVPVNPRGEFEKLILAVDPERLLIRRLTVVGSAGDTMAFEFFDLDENVPLDDEQFRFEPPPGVEVLSSR